MGSNVYDGNEVFFKTYVSSHAVVYYTYKTLRPANNGITNYIFY